MAIKTHKPTSPSMRGYTSQTNDELTRSKPEKSLTKGKHKTGGRNNMGLQTSRHRGGGHKRSYRQIDFLRDKDGVPAKVARIALLHYKDGEKRYILAPEGLAVGTLVQTGPDSDIKPGNSMPIINIPEG